MSFRDDIDRACELLAEAIAELPESQQENAVLTIVSSAMREMPTPVVIEIRAEILAEIDDSAIRQHAIDMIDGQLALRAMEVQP